MTMSGIMDENGDYEPDPCPDVCDECLEWEHQRYRATTLKKDLRAGNE